MDSEILALQQQVAEKEKENSLHLSQNIFENRKESTNSAVPVADKKEQLVENMFEQAVVHEVANNAELQDNVLETAKVYTSTKMQTIKTKVDTEHKEAVFDNRKDACESYGFNEKTTPIWATRVMSWGYNVCNMVIHRLIYIHANHIHSEEDVCWFEENVVSSHLRTAYLFSSYTCSYFGIGFKTVITLSVLL